MNFPPLSQLNGNIIGLFSGGVCLAMGIYFFWSYVRFLKGRWTKKSGDTTP